MKRPLIATKPISEFGELDPTLEDAEYFDNPDLTTVPGWSEMRHQREVQMAEYTQGTRAGSDVMALPVNVRWVRCRSVSGNEDGVKLMRSRNDGYRPATKEDIGKAWLTEMPVGSRALPDGAIVNSAGDCQLMVCEARVAARNLKRKTQRWLDASGSIEKAPESDDQSFKFRTIVANDNHSIVDHAQPVKESGRGTVKPRGT